MRKVAAYLFITLDGVVESPDKWQFDFDADMMEAMVETINAQDAVLLGRVTYEEWAPYWPTSNHQPFADFINNTQKYLFSSTVENVEAWQNTTLIQGDLAEAIHALKQQPGKNIGTAGSPTLVRALIEQGLVDEIVLLLHPVIAGSGKRLFADEKDLQRLTLISATSTASGVVVLTYQPLREA